MMGWRVDGSKERGRGMMGRRRREKNDERVEW